MTDTPVPGTPDEPRQPSDATPENRAPQGPHEPIENARTPQHDPGSGPEPIAQPEPTAQYDPTAQPSAAQPQPTERQRTEPIPPGLPYGADGLNPPVGATTAPEKKRSNIGTVAALVIGALVGGVSGAGVATWAITSGNDGQAGGPGASPATITVNDGADATLITAIAAEAGPSVVTISVAGGSASGTGSGVILDNDGHIVTNTHVVTLDGESADSQIQVQTYDGHLYPGTLVGTDPLTDLAVIKIDAQTDLQPIKFGDSSNLNVGDTTVAIGAPLGLSNTVTNGIVSALNRSITVASSAPPEGDTPESPQSPFDFWEFGQDQPQQSQQSSQIYLPVIQTDAAINPGNSGGALLDAKGDLIGVNVAIASTGGAAAGNIGVGFAVPANVVKRIADEIIKNGEATHGLIGASVINVTLDQDISEKSIVGASVKEISGGGAAEAAGLREGDIVTSFNDVPITGSIDLTAQVRALAPGTTVPMTFVRDGEVQKVDITVGSLE
ncbi:trypsin-like peptidase domain-containing protein [Cryobacterium sp. BB736]|uniref:trypsin-like peptidase domain-containing protein n=1 Tax=Cryobacterium sp. BB736 TaxID=2746963 RepID=UPI00187526F1|nr:trypsin-like peptidase domain-containing protein [Cryobacterium sp. BB736]